MLISLNKYFIFKNFKKSFYKIANKKKIKLILKILLKLNQIKSFNYIFSKKKNFKILKVFISYIYNYNHLLKFKSYLKNSSNFFFKKKSLKYLIKNFNLNFLILTSNGLRLSYLNKKIYGGKLAYLIHY